ncbi:MAG: ABC transporter permease [Acidobacteria bacterium]|nr:ABC transporter permease [Acidobacteriota bacterium]MBK8149207.1 ABC transporter permease [Acidobacteriota bacterium]MBK8811231.1 ABC transporter permease [Acidobacteriota bacterium]
MNFSETIRLAFAAIWAHKLRSFLTLLGMIIGVTAFMLVLSLLQGFNAYVDEKIAGIGSNSFTIRRFSFDDFKNTDTIAEAQRRNKELTFDELDYIRERSQLIGKIGAKALPNSAELKRGNEILRDVQIEGMEPVIGEIANVDIAFGRFFTEAENTNAVRVAFIGSEIADKLFPNGDVIGQEFTMRGIPYRVIGVQTTKGTVFGQSQDLFVWLPIKTYGANFGGLTRGRGLYFEATAASPKLFNEAVEEVRMLLRVKRKLTGNERDNFGILTPDAIASLRDSILRPIFIVILAVPAIALLVGAIVIMNIMLVAVTERTKEIGIRKSLGARQADILKQFLMEAATLAAIGGVIGLVMAKLLGMIVTAYVLQTVIPWYAAVIAISVSAIVGILAGIFPAWKAARLDPIEALRAD